MFCSSCGAEVGTETTCPKCGAVVNPAAAAPAAAQAAPAQAAPAQPQVVVQMPAPAKTSGLAIAGFILSFFFSLVGVILSIVALVQINKSNGTLTGKGFAIAGIIIGALSMVFTTIWIVIWIAFLASGGGDYVTYYG